MESEYRLVFQGHWGFFLFLVLCYEMCIESLEDRLCEELFINGKIVAHGLSRIGVRDISLFRRSVRVKGQKNVRRRSDDALNDGFSLQDIDVAERKRKGVALHCEKVVDLI